MTNDDDLHQVMMQVTPVVQNLPANAGDVRNMSSIPRLGRSPGGGHGNPLQYFCLENPMDRETWQATVHRVSRVGHNRSDLARTHTMMQKSRWLDSELILKVELNRIC